VALTYVWGACDPGALIKCCVGGIDHFNLPEVVPQTIQDAINIILGLGGSTRFTFPTSNDAYNLQSRNCHHRRCRWVGHH
jgi:hypothetical protein